MKMILYSHKNEPGKVLHLLYPTTRKGCWIATLYYHITLSLMKRLFLPLNQSLKEQKLLDSIDHELTGRPSRLYTYFSLTWKFIRPLFKLFLYQSIL